ncbi:MAG: thiolase family protein [Acidimicrobiia bacterium]|nr:thiolase family protein [Acidimicrobiia bacterium]NNF64964.1 thiolase family protein [Acidimicrobiia bacterium]
MHEAVIVASKRTPLAKGYRGSLNMTRADDMAAHAIRAALDSVPAVSDGDVEDVIMGCGLPEGPSGQNVGRIAALRAGLPSSVPGTTVNRFCSSGLNTIAMAAHRVQVGEVDTIIAGGVESITGVQNENFRSVDLFNVPLQKDWPGIYLSMGETAEIVAKRYDVSREAQDVYSLMSQQRTAHAQEQGWYTDDIAPIKVDRAVKQSDGSFAVEEGYVFSSDEANRPSTTLEGLSSLPPVFDKENGSVTAGNASQFADGASASVLMSKERADELGVEVLGTFRGFQVAGVDPDEMGIGPVKAVPKLLDMVGLSMDDIDVVELNEAFASQVLYCQRTLGIPDEKLNPMGGSISIGHPYGMSGARMVGQILRHLRRTGGRYGIVTMCVGGGQGAAGLFEVS